MVGGVASLVAAYISAFLSIQVHFLPQNKLLSNVIYKTIIMTLQYLGF